MTSRIRNIENGLNAGFSANEIRGLLQSIGFLMGAYKKTVTTVSASTVLINDPDMWTELYGAGQHKIDMYLPTTMTAAGGFKVQFVADQGLTIANISLQVEYLLNGAATPTISNIAGLGVAVNGGTTNAYTAVRISGTVDVVNGGVLQMQFAQAVASGATAINPGAVLRAEQITTDGTF